MEARAFASFYKRGRKPESCSSASAWKISATVYKELSGGQK